MRMPLVCLLAPLVACAPAPPTSDAPARDGGAKADGAGLGFRLVAPSSARRGPTRLSFAATGAAPEVASLRLEFAAADGWRAASTLGPIREEEGGLAVTWDSFRDVAADGRVSLRLATETGALAFDVDLRNAPGADRLLSVTHPLVAGTTGGATGKGRSLGLLRWSGRDGSVTGSPRRLEVDAGPRAVRASPDGRFLGVLAASAHTVTLVRTPLDGDPAGVTVERSVTLPDVSPLDLAWSHDGRRLLVTAMGDGVDSSSLWAIDAPVDDGPFEWMEQLATLPGPPLKVAVAPDGRILVFCGSGGRGLDKLVLLEADGRPLSQLEADMATPNALAFSRDGRRAVMTSTFYGDEVRLLDTTDAIAFVGEPLTAIASPFGVAFHPTAPDVGLITQLDRNRATPFTLGGPGLRLGTTVSGLGLAGAIDVVERGPYTGTVLATGVSGSSGVVHALRLGASGGLTASSPIVLGAGAESIADGVAIQR